MKVPRIRSILTAFALAAAGIAIAAAPAQAAPAPLFGAPDNASYLSTYGPVDMYRVFYGPDVMPGAWATDPHLNVSQPLNVSFRFDPAAVLAGTWDSRLRTWFSAAPTNRPIWWTFHHEPDRHNLNAAQYRSAWQHIWAIAHEPAVYKGNVKATTVLQDYDLTFQPGDTQYWENWYPGDQYVDVMSWDLYSFQNANGTYQTLADHEVKRPLLPVVQAHNKPWAVSEVGFDNVPSRPQFLRDLAAWARSNGAQFVSYYDFDNGANGSGNYTLSDSASQQAWQSAVNGSLFAGTVTASDNPPTSITRNAATMSCAVDPHNLSYRVTVASWTTVGGNEFFETPGVAVSDGPETVTSTRSNFTPNTSYTFRCKVYDSANNLILKPPTQTFITLP